MHASAEFNGLGRCCSTFRGDLDEEGLAGAGHFLDLERGLVVLWFLVGGWVVGGGRRDFVAIKDCKL